MFDCKDKISQVKLALLAMQRHSWEQGTAMQAFLEQGDEITVIAMAKEAVYRSMEDGRTAVLGVTDAVTDPCSVGEALLHACHLTGDEALIKGKDQLLHWVLDKAPRSRKGILYHLVDKPQFWVDSMYMLPPFLAAAGYYEEALHQLYGYWDALYQKEHRLMSHMWDEGEQQFAREDHWGVGNGWALAAISRMIDLLPQERQQDRERLKAMARELLDGVLTYVCEDGLFHDVVDQPETFKEVNLSQMTAYTIFRGLRSGWLPKTMEPMAKRLREAAWNQVDQYGLVQNVCGAPNFDRPGVAPEGQAFFLLMEAAASIQLEWR